MRRAPQAGLWSTAVAVATICAAAPALAIDTRRPLPPQPSGETIVVHQTIILHQRNSVYDYGGATLIWKGSGDCSQKENMPPIFRISGRGITVRNATIIGAPDGIHIANSGIRIQNISFPDVCEDAITMKAGARWARISGCYFAKAADKAIQCTHGYGHHIFDNTFVDVKCAFRSKPGANASFYRNRLYYCGSAVRADGRRSNTKTWGNTFIFVRHPYQPLGRAIIRQLDDDLQVK